MKRIISMIPMRKTVFYILVLCTMLPLLLFPYISLNYHQIHHQIHQVPSVSDGEIDLTGYDFYSGIEIPLDGKWEFYYDRWIISEPEEDQTPDLMAPVPTLWSYYDMDGGPLPARGRGSYRLLLRNCPGDAELLVYIPNISSHYRTYLNGELVSSRGSMYLPGDPKRTDKAYYLEVYGTQVPAHSDAEVVIELQSPHIGGLYLTPVLAEHGTNHVNRDFRNIVAAACIGIMSVSIVCIACYMLFRDKLLYSAALLGMDVLVYMRFLVRDEFFEVIRQVIPGFRYYVVNSCLQIAIFSLPFIFMLCMSQLFHMKVKKREVLLTGAYLLLLSPILIWCTINGRVRLHFFTCLAGYLPFIYICMCLYKEVVSRKPYSLLVSASLLFIMSSVMSASLVDSGLLVMNVSLFSPVYFVIAMVLQLMLFIIRGFELKIQATEAENLRLRLKDSETSLMLSQIQPHFLYNTLIAIHMMCLEEPEMAAETTMKFATFLRTNMRFIRDLRPIPFKQELEHIRNYTDIEKIRFQGRLSVNYVIETDKFVIPALTIQPLVENAIRHGATKNIDGGSVTIHTFEKEGAFCIEVTDDGPGFDTAILEDQGSDSFGISNILFRLKEQVSAEVRFESSPGCNTTVTITIPRGGGAVEDHTH